MWVVGVCYKEGAVDPVGYGTKADISDIQINVDDVRSMQLYFLDGNINETDVKRIAEELLTDPVLQEYKCGKATADLTIGKSHWFVTTKPKAGVMDAVGLGVTEAVRILGVNGITIASGNAYRIFGKRTQQQIEKICRKCLSNELIEDVAYEWID